MNKQTEQLEKNELVEWLDKKFGHLRPYKSQIGFGIVAFIVLCAAFAYLIKSRVDLHAVQWQNLSSAVNAFYLDSQTSHLFNLADEYPDAEASMWALLLASDIEMQIGLEKLNSDTNAAVKNIDKSRKGYQKLLDSKAKRSPEMIQRAVYGLAYAQESLGEFDAAKKTYQRILDEAQDSIYKEPATMALQRLANPDFVAFYAAYKKTSVAPMGDLPPRPNISFPEPVAPPPDAPSATGGGTEGNTTSEPAKTDSGGQTPPVEGQTPEPNKKDGEKSGG